MTRSTPRHPENFDILSLVPEEFGKGFSALDYLLPKTYLSLNLSHGNAIKIGLMNYLLVLSIFEDALDTFLHHKYRMFDALVGNNTCYSVAYAIFLIAYRSKNSDFTAYIHRVKANITQLKSAVLAELDSFNKNHKHPHANFESFLKEKNLALSADLSLVYLFLAFTCSIAKRKNENDTLVVDFDSLSEQYNANFDIKKQSIAKLVKHWQKCISVLSVKILQASSTRLTYPETLWARYIFDPYILEDQNTRLCTPSLFATRVIYNMLLAMPETLIGLQVNLVERPKKFISRFTVYFEVQEDGSLKVPEQDEISSIRPIYMFAGCRYVPEGASVDIDGLKKEFSQRNLQEIIFAHEVTYPQYPKSLKVENIFPEEPELKEEILRLKAMPGFSFDDPSDLCLVHLFVDDTKTQSLAIHEPPTYLPRLNCLDD